MPRPAIGIICNSGVLDGDYPIMQVGVMNMDAVAQVADATPLLLTASPDYATIPDLMARCDGFLFTGGRPNVHPHEYGEEPTEAHGDFDRDRDRLTLPLIRACVLAGQPILGLCRGFQEINVALGGTLYPEIRDLPGRMNHRMPPEGTVDEKFALRHEVTFTENGPFHQLLGAQTVTTNSLHGQGIKQAGKGIVIDGFAPDETPEAIYVQDAKGFALGVQWHPEYQAGLDAVSKPLFEAFGDAVRDFARGR